MTRPGGWTLVETLVTAMLVVLVLGGLFLVFSSSGRVAGEAGMVATVHAVGETLRQSLERDCLPARRWEFPTPLRLEVWETLDPHGQAVSRVTYLIDPVGRKVTRQAGASETAFLLFDPRVPAREFTMRWLTQDADGRPTTLPASMTTLVCEIACQKNPADPRHVLPLLVRRAAPLSGSGGPGNPGPVLEWPGH